VRMDETQRGWLVASIVILAACLAVYVLTVTTDPKGARGGSTIGIIFGSIGYGFMIFAALLGARKRVPIWRLGRAQAWMRGHLWLGFLSLPVILFHGGFHFGGTLTRILMWMLIITVLSGVFGAVLQNYIPRMMTSDAPLETIYSEIGHVRNLMREEADHAVEALLGPIGLPKSANEEALRAGGFTAVRAVSSMVVVGRGATAAAVAPAPEIQILTHEEGAPLRRFYLDEMRPFLEHPNSRGARLADPGKSQSVFSGLRTLLPAIAHPTITDLEDVCEEARQLERQSRLHHWLHTWLLVHIPLSLALVLLGAVHAVMALRY
jgi:hypothetical protein